LHATGIARSLAATDWFRRRLSAGKALGVEVMRHDLRVMSPTENWLWALAEARQENETHRARLIASSALTVWRSFMSQRRPARRAE